MSIYYINLCYIGMVGFIKQAKFSCFTFAVCWRNNVPKSISLLIGYVNTRSRKCKLDCKVQ